MHAIWKSFTFGQIVEQWDELLPNSFTNEIFLTHVWQNIWWKKFGSGTKPQLFGLIENSRLIGVAPLLKQDETITFIGGTDLFDYHDFVVMVGKEELFYEKLPELIQDIGFGILDLKSIPENSPTLELLSQNLRKIGVDVETYEEDVAPFLKLQGTWEQYLAGLNKKNRHEINRKMRRLGSSGSYAHEICHQPDVHPTCMDDFIRLMKLSSPVKSEFLTPSREQFFRDLSSGLPAPEIFRLSFLQFNGIRVASCVSFQYNGTVYLYNSGYDPGFSHLSIGLMNTILCIKDAINSKQAIFDFLRGSERYKYNLGGEDRTLFQLRATK